MKILPPEVTAEAVNTLTANWMRHLVLNPYGWERDVRRSKVEGLHAAEADPNGEILLLHADTIFKSRRDHLPTRAVSGRDYDLTALISGQAVPQQAQLV